MKLRLRPLLLACMTLATAPWSLAQDTTGPRPVRIVLGSAPGASSDAVSRLLAESFSRTMGRTFLVDNRPGASSNIAADHVAKSSPDGNTLLLIYNAHPAVGALFPNLPYDPIKDFRSVGMVGTTPYVLVANPNLPGRNFAEVIAQAKAGKRRLSYATPGAGTPQHLMMERLKQLTGVDITMVHYKSSAPAQSDVMAGHVDMTLSTPSLGMPQVKAGKVKALAVTSAERLPESPEAPTLKESGIENFVSVGWFALLIPAKTPDAIAKRYTDELNHALSTEPVKGKLLAMGITPVPGPAEVLDRQMQGDAAMWTKLINELGIKPE